MENPIQIPAPQMGVRPDLDPESIDDAGLANAENMLYRDGNFQIRPGFSKLGNNFSQRPMGYISVDHGDGTKRFIQATTVGWRSLTGGTWTDISGTALTGTATDQQVFRTFPKAGATWTLGINGANTMKKWDGATATYSDVAGSPPRARCMAVLFDRVVVGNLLSGGTISPVAIDVSANKDFDAGWSTQLVALLAETEGPIQSILEMGSLNGAILKTDAVYLLIAQGGVVPFRIQLVKEGISGPASTLLSTKLTDGSIAMLGMDALLSIFDSSAVIPQPYAIQKHISNTFNQSRINRGWMTYDSTRRELWLVYPLKGSDEPNGGAMINMGTKQIYPFRFSTFKASAGGKFLAFTGITIGELTMPIGQITQTIGDLGSNNAARRLILGDTGGQSYSDIGVSDDGTAIPFFWETPVHGTPERFKTIGRMRHRFKPTPASQTVTVKIGKRNQGGDIAYGTGKSINLASNLRMVTGHRTSAEYFSLRFEGNASQEIVYQGSAPYLKPRGNR